MRPRLFEATVIAGGIGRPLPIAPIGSSTGA